MKLRAASKRWHRKALMIDPKKTLLVFEMAAVESEITSPLVYSELTETEPARQALNERQLDPGTLEPSPSSASEMDWIANVKTDNCEGSES